MIPATMWTLALFFVTVIPNQNCFILPCVPRSNSNVCLPNFEKQRTNNLRHFEVVWSQEEWMEESEWHTCGHKKIFLRIEMMVNHIKYGQQMKRKSLSSDVQIFYVWWFPLFFMNIGKEAAFVFSLMKKCPHRRKNMFRHFSWTKAAAKQTGEILCEIVCVAGNTLYHNPIAPLSVHSVQITAFWWDIKLTSSQWIFFYQ